MRHQKDLCVDLEYRRASKTDQYLLAAKRWYFSSNFGVWNCRHPRKVAICNGEDYMSINLKKACLPSLNRIPSQFLTDFPDWPASRTIIDQLFFWRQSGGVYGLQFLEQLESFLLS